MMWLSKVRGASHLVVVGYYLLLQGLDSAVGSSSFPKASHINIEPRIVHGHNATPGRYPYFASISIHFSFLNVRICGGALIAPDVVLTAAHCWQGPDLTLAAQIGIFSIEDQEIVYHDVLHYLPNPLFGVYNVFDRDVMLLILNGTSSNAIVRLNRNGEIPKCGQSMVTIGLGATNSTLAGPFPTVLQKLEILAIPNSQCERATDGNFTYQGLLTDTMVCGLHPNAGPCYVDSGGPLILEGGDAFQDVLLGTVSWDNGCVSSIFPNVYARVSGVVDWIDANVCHYSQNPPSDFRCQQGSNLPAPSPSVPDVRSVPVTVQFVFVSAASYTWWFILNDLDALVFIHPRYSYASNATYDQQVVMLPVGHNYTFAVRNDAYNNLGRLARFAVRLGSHGNGEALVYSLGGTYDLEVRGSFTLSDSITLAPASTVAATFPPSESPTIGTTATPSITRTPTLAAPSVAPSSSLMPSVTPAPTSQKQDVTIIIHFKGFPSEIGYKILDYGNKAIIDVPFGTYGAFNVTIRAVVPLTTRQSYEFVIMDFFGDNFWPGSYSLFLGSPGFEGPDLVSGTGVEGFEERHSFYVPPPAELSSSTSHGKLKESKKNSKAEKGTKASAVSGKGRGKIMSKMSGKGSNKL